MDKLKEAIVIIFSLAAGLFLIYFAYLMLTDYPPKSALIWLPNSEVSEVKYSASKDSIKGMCFFNKDGLCLSVNSKEEGFAQLLAATKNGAKYSIGYNKERAILSDDPTLYNMVYEIQIGGTVVRSYDERIRGLKYFNGGIGLVGVFLIGFSLYRLRRIVYQQSTAFPTDVDLIDKTSTHGHSNRLEVNKAMSQSEGKQLLIAFPMLAGSLLVMGFSFWLGSQFGMSRWLTGLVMLTLYILCLTLFRFRQYDQLQKRGLLLMAGGLTVLTFASLANEYIRHFFTPSAIYLILAISPTLIISAYDLYLVWKNEKGASVKNILGDVSTRDQWFRIFRGEAQGVEYSEEKVNTTTTNFVLNGASVHVPSQTNDHTLINEHDHVEICGRPSLYAKNRMVCLAYKLNGDETIHVVSEGNISIAIVGIILAFIYILVIGWKWPLVIVVLVSIFNATPSYWTFRARSRLANSLHQSKPFS